MIVKQIIDEDFTNYKKPSMHIVFGNCDWKCGRDLCHNKEIAAMPDIEVDSSVIVKKYLKNPIISAVVINGLEPFNSFEDMIAFIDELRKFTRDIVVIYTGYTEEEVELELSMLKKYENIVCKFGRYLPNQEPHYDEILGVNLASNNQYGKVIS